MSEFEQPTVFVIEDDFDMRNTLQKLLADEGLPAAFFDSANQFLDSYKEEPGCLVVDLVLPGMTGLELCREIKSRGVILPFLIITGQGSVTEAVEAMQLGAVDFLEKPFRGQDFIKRVNVMLEHALKIAAFKGELELLTPREKEFFDLLVVGKSVKEISMMLEISSKTGHIHRGNVLGK